MSSLPDSQMQNLLRNARRYSTDAEGRSAGGGYDRSVSPLAREEMGMSDEEIERLELELKYAQDNEREE